MFDTLKEMEEKHIYVNLAKERSAIRVFSFGSEEAN